MKTRILQLGIIRGGAGTAKILHPLKSQSMDFPNDLKAVDLENLTASVSPFDNEDSRVDLRFGKILAVAKFVILMPP